MTALSQHDDTRIDDMRSDDIGFPEERSDDRRSDVRTRGTAAPAPQPEIRIDVSIVVVTAGDAALGKLLRSLVEADPDHRVHLHQLVMVDDRVSGSATSDTVNRRGTMLELEAVGAAWMSAVADQIDVVRSAGRGFPDALRRALPTVSSEWAIVLDEQVTVNADWWHCLADDLCGTHERIGASLGLTVDLRSPTSDAAGRKRFASDRALRVPAVDDVSDPSPESGAPNALMRAGWALSLGTGWALSLGTRTTAWSGGASEFELELEAAHDEPAPLSRTVGRVIRLDRSRWISRTVARSSAGLRRVGAETTRIGRSVRSATGYRRTMTDHSSTSPTADSDDVQAVADETSKRVQPADPMVEPPNSTVDDWFGQQVQADTDRVDEALAEGRAAPKNDGGDADHAAPSDSMQAADAANGESTALSEDV